MKVWQFLDVPEEGTTTPPVSPPSEPPVSDIPDIPPDIPDTPLPMSLPPLTERPDSVRVQLLRNGQEAETVTLTQDNDWQYTWDDLDPRYTWSVVETEVPDGYVMTTETMGDTVVITNTEQKNNTPEPDIKEPAVDKYVRVMGEDAYWGKGTDADIYNGSQK